MSYHPLKFQKLNEGATYHRSEHSTLNHVKLSDPAIKVMTDLQYVEAITVSPSVKIDDALKTMIEKGVRMLFVIDEKHQIIGLVTTNDISGERPLQMSGSSKILRNEIVVKDLMVPVEKIDVVPLKDINKAKVGDVLETLKSVNRRHILVADHQGFYKEMTIRGIFSMTKIEKQLGLLKASV